MSRAIIVPAIAALLGLVIGGSSVELAHRQNNRRAKESFAQKERCKSLADRYIHENSKDGTDLLLKEVDFSPASNSCIAALQGYTNFPAGLDEEWELVDLLSGKKTFIGSCSEERNCGNGRNMHLEERLGTEFRSAIAGTEPPPDTPNN